ncbi:hypothetical protein F5Y12DRAFT_755759 [Xylaria sp. FL1777]|nr:hypothetical protein F5Y12DRAFT_755759 [Xylaria sp. FL1777]
MAPLIPNLVAHARSILSSAVNTRSQAVQTASSHVSQIGPLAARAILLARDDNKDTGQSSDPPAMDPSSGVINPHDINNTGIFVLFGLIGVAFVLTGIWFFFWAKNGGFYFKETDWEDYKSTVLRRKGPNGTLLSNATPSTNLGGGSVYKDVDDGSTEYTGGLTQMTGDTSDTMSTLTGITAGPSDIAGRERRRRAREKKEREHEKKRDRRKGRRKVGEDGALVDEEAEADAKRNLREYRHERAARVGGLNKQSEASEWDGSTNPEMSTVSGSELLLNNRQSTPTSTPTKEKRRSRSTKDKHQEEHHDAAPSEMTYESSSQASKSNISDSTTTTTTRKAGGIRKVYSTADRTNMRENERLRAEARRLAEKGRAAAAASSSASSTYHRRDYSYQRADLRNPGSTIAEEQQQQQPPQETGSLMMDDGNDIGNGRYLPAPESWVPESDIGDGSDLGTKSYHHYIPGISSSSPSAAEGSAVDSSAGAPDYNEERRERRRRRDAERSRR